MNGAAARPTREMPSPGSAGAWLLAARPKTLTAAWAPVFVGTACAVAAGGLDALVALAALLGASLIQIGTNFANDVFDYEKGADDENRLGPTRAVQAGLLTPRQMRAGMIVAFGLATLAGVYLVVIGGWPVVAIGLASIASGIAYTGGPFPLGYNGLGDLFVMVFFGFVAVCCTTWLQVGELVPASVVCAAGVGALATAVLVVNNVRDAETDVHVGKRTLVVRLGRTAGLVEYGAMVALALAVPPVLAFGFGYGTAVWLAFVIIVPGVALTIRLARATTGDEHNALLAKTAALLLIYSLLLSAGVVLGAP